MADTILPDPNRATVPAGNNPTMGGTIQPRAAATADAASVEARLRQAVVDALNDPMVYDVNGAVQALVNWQKANAPSQANLPTVLNVGGGKLAIIDPAKAGTDQYVSFTDAGPAPAGKTTQSNVIRDGRQIALTWDEAGNVTNAVDVGPDPAIAAAERQATQASATSAQNAAEASALSAQNARQQAASSAQASQQAIDQYNAKVAADAKVWQDQVDQGYVMKPADLAALNAANARSLAELEASLNAAREQAQWEREQPFKERAAAVSEQQTAETSRHNLATEEGTRTQTATGVLTKQAEAGQNIIGEAIKHGVQIGMPLVRFAFDPYATAMNMVRQGVQAGAIHPSQVPPPTAPQPQTAPVAPPPIQASAPLPAYAVTPHDIPPSRDTFAPSPAPTPTSGGNLVQTPANRDMYWTE